MKFEPVMAKMGELYFINIYVTGKRGTENRLDTINIGDKENLLILKKQIQDELDVAE